MQFGSLQFKIEEGKINLVGQGGVQTKPYGFAQVQILGENKPTALGAKTAKTSEGMQLVYSSHELTENKLVIVQRTDRVEVKTVFTKGEACEVIRVYLEVKNLTDEDIVLEEVGFSLQGLFNISVDEAEKVFITQFHQGHHKECQPRRRSLYEYGHSYWNDESQSRAFVANVGSQSTKEFLPLAILEYEGQFCMFQIESNHSWLYEVGDVQAQFYLTLSGANFNQLHWAKKLAPNESYTSVVSAFVFGRSVEEVVGEMMGYRRSLVANVEADKNQPVVFNEYMWFSWDSPEEERTKKMAPIAAAHGADIYVIDCGWHNEEPGNIIYPYVGQWKESQTRFPHGVRAITDYIRSLGMKAGLWIEPEIVGMKCEEMLSYYEPECFAQRFGKPIIASRRRFLDYRHPKVRAYMTESIRRMVEEYGAEYIKFDYNQDMGAGTDKDALTFGEGLEQLSVAYLSWVDEIRQTFPQVIFENCASGGCRMDYQSLSRFHLASTSDCTSYDLYPYVSANLSAAIIPTQAGVWCYPVAALKNSEDISDDRVVVNVVNALLGRMHLASDLSVLNDGQSQLLKEGIALYKRLNEVREKGTPVLPFGFTQRGKKELASGLRLGDTLYLCVWNLGLAAEMEIPVGAPVRSVEVVYPSNRGISAAAKKESVVVSFDKVRMAAFLKIEL